MARTRRTKIDNEGSKEDTDVEIIGEQGPTSMAGTAAGASTSPEDNPANTYLDQLNMLAQLWSQNVITNQAGSYRELMEQLLELAHKIFPLLAQADAEAVLDSVEDSPGSFLAGERGFALQVSKEDSIIHRKRWASVERTEEVKVALADYYDAACGLVDAQGRFMDALEELGRLVLDHDTLMNIIKHVQCPCVQVTAEAEKLEARLPQFPKGKAAKRALSDYYEMTWDLANNYGAYMEKLGHLQEQCSDQNVFLNVTNHVYIPNIQVTVMSRHHEETAEGRTFQQLATTRNTPNHNRLPASCSGSTLTLVALVHFVLFRQISGQVATVAECARDFKCDATVLEQITTGKTVGDKQSKGPAHKRKSSKTGEKSAKKTKCDDNDDDDE